MMALIGNLKITNPAFGIEELNYQGIKSEVQRNQGGIVKEFDRINGPKPGFTTPMKHPSLRRGS
jgi:hypothetical protein